MLSWLRGPRKSKAVQSAWVPEMVDRVSRHVEEQVFAITGRRGAPLPPYSSMTDLLIGAYTLGALEGYARTIPDVQNAPESDSTRELLRVAANEVCSRVFDPEWVKWVRSRLPQWDGPPAYHPTFRRELSSMGCRGARDGRHLAANDPLSFAKAGSLLAFLLELTEPQMWSCRSRIHILVLARGLKDAGYEVVLATAARFETFVTAWGISFPPRPDDFLELMDTPCGKAALSGCHTLTSTVRLVREVGPMMRRLLDAQWTVAQGADAIIYHPRA